ncbi:hypothetical protein [Actinocorallia longicatena]|uniref:Secreted protein n=1 Tax=Actinocorallia longicatena TaxID=111803 RepID=A0ABP6QLR9_9ACTN
MKFARTRLLGPAVVLAAAAVTPLALDRLATAAEPNLAYSCALPGGPADIAVSVAGGAPAGSAFAGYPVALGNITLSVPLPREVLPADAASVAGTAEVAATATEAGAAPVPLAWPALTIATTALTTAAPTLTAKGIPAAYTPKAAGDTVISLGAFTLKLTPAGATAPTTLACTPKPGTVTVLSTIKAEAAPEVGDCGKITAADPSPAGKPGCVYMSGFANVKKLKGASVLNDPAVPGDLAMTNIIVHQPKGGRLLVEVEFATPLQAKATFLGFGFMPTSATMRLTQVSRGFADLDFKDPKNLAGNAVVEMAITVSDATVNGTPLKVGPKCRSARNVKATLTVGPGYTATNGGSMAGEFEIPPFRDCGVGEDISPVLTALVSGPGNYLKLMQSKICVPPSKTLCPPVVPPLKR